MHATTPTLPHRRTRVRRPVSIHDNDTEMMYVNEVANTDI